MIWKNFDKHGPSLAWVGRTK